MTASNQLVARNVRRFRLERSLSLGELARRSSLSKQTLSKIELAAGDFVRFPGDVPHRYACLSDRVVAHMVTSCRRCASSVRPSPEAERPAGNKVLRGIGTVLSGHQIPPEHCHSAGFR